MTPPVPLKRAAFADIPASKQLLLLMCNTIPLLHVLSLIGVGWALRRHPLIDAIALVLLLYLLPPLACRIALRLWPISETSIRVGTRAFYVWWFTANCQVLFCRFACLDEALRLVPGLYSAWLRAWGSRVGKLTYWSPGTRVLDRGYLRIGDHVTLGAGVRLNGHVLLHGTAGDLRLALAPIAIGDRALIGGYALLTAGTVVAAGEVTQACLAVPPFSRIEGGRRLKPAAPPS